MNNYAFVVIDNEAGMEHISRLTTNNIDLLLMVSDSSHRGIKSAARIDELTQSLSLNIGRRLLILNQAKEEDRAYLLLLPGSLSQLVEGSLSLQPVYPGHMGQRDMAGDLRTV